MSTATMTKLNFGQWIRLQRDLAGLSQQATADALGVTRQTVSNWERCTGEPGISLVVAQKMAAAFGLSLDAVSKGVAGEYEIPD